MSTIKIPLELHIDTKIGLEPRIYCENGNYYPIAEYNLKENPLLAAIINNVLNDLKEKIFPTITLTMGIMKEG